jgi:hypothetical protein
MREAAAAADPPLTNLSEERLRRRFAGSAVLPHLQAVLPSSILFSDAAHLRSLVRLLGVAVRGIQRGGWQRAAAAGVSRQQ